MSFLQKINPAKPNNIIVLTIISVVWVNFNIVLWQNENVLKNDVAVYYSYLPSVFYHHDISQEFLKKPENFNLLSRFVYPMQLPNGNYVFKTTMGMSLTYLPFFVAAHYYAKIFDQPMNAYSEPYQFAIQFSSLFYCIIGLIFLIKILRSFFRDPIISLSIFILIFGTNMLYYLTVGAGMSHIASFGLVCCYIYYVIKWHSKPNLKGSLMIGIFLGLLTLIRPINILVLVFFIFYNVKSLNGFKIKFKLLFDNKIMFFLIGIVSFLIILPQLIYWKHQTGTYFFNSYVGERFYFNRPQIINGLLSFRKGWLIYSPLMVFSLVGFLYLYKLSRDYFFPIFILFLIYIYVAFSWWCWWYGGSYGQRALIDIYPFMAIPLSAFLFYIGKLNDLNKKFIYSVITILVVLNLHHTMQAKWNNIHFDSMTKEAYMDTFFRFSKNPEAEKYLKHPDIDKAKAGINEY